MCCLFLLLISGVAIGQGGLNQDYLVAIVEFRMLVSIQRTARERMAPLENSPSLLIEADSDSCPPWGFHPSDPCSNLSLDFAEAATSIHEARNLDLVVVVVVGAWASSIHEADCCVVQVLNQVSDLSHSILNC